MSADTEHIASNGGRRMTAPVSKQMQDARRAAGLDPLRITDPAALARLSRLILPTLGNRGEAVNGSMGRSAAHRLPGAADTPVTSGCSPNRSVPQPPPIKQERRSADREVKRAAAS